MEVRHIRRRRESFFQQTVLRARESFHRLRYHTAIRPGRQEKKERKLIKYPSHTVNVFFFLPSRGFNICARPGEILIRAPVDTRSRITSTTCVRFVRNLQIGWLSLLFWSRLAMMFFVVRVHELSSPPGICTRSWLRTSVCYRFPANRFPANSRRHVWALTIDMTSGWGK